jgi:hypothetical protein
VNYAYTFTVVAPPPPPTPRQRVLGALLSAGARRTLAMTEDEFAAMRNALANWGFTLADVRRQAQPGWEAVP